MARGLIAEEFARSDGDATDDEQGTPRPPDPVDDAEARLAYVAVTRTRRRLDVDGLSWIHDHPDGTPTGHNRPHPPALPQPPAAAGA